MLEVDDTRERAAVAGGEPAEPETRETVRLRDGAERERALVQVARRGQPIGWIVLQLAIHLVGEEPGSALGTQLDDTIEHGARHRRARGIVRSVDVDELVSGRSARSSASRSWAQPPAAKRRHSVSSAPAERATWRADS